MNFEEIKLLYLIQIQICCLLLRYNMLKEKKRNQRHFAMRRIMNQRGFLRNSVPSTRLTDVETFKNFYGMEPKTFFELLHLLGPHIMDETVCDEITPCDRLAVTLRYLSSGSSMKSAGSYGFRLGALTTSHIVRETCQLIWENLQFVFPEPSEEMWENIAKDFEEKWGFPNCLGAIDGKHVVVQLFPNRNSHSLTLMAVVDAHYKFIMVDVGTLGYNSYNSILKASKFSSKILHHPELLYIPEAKTLPNFNKEVSFVFVGDEAFPLRKNIMRPYPVRNISGLPPGQSTFNERLSRARKVVQNAFGIMTSRFRIYHRLIVASERTATNILKSTVCLHNWLLNQNYVSEEESNLNNQIETANNSHDLQLICLPQSNHATQDAIAVRNSYTEYFQNETDM